MSVVKLIFYFQAVCPLVAAAHWNRKEENEILDRTQVPTINFVDWHKPTISSSEIRIKVMTNGIRRLNILPSDERVHLVSSGDWLVTSSPPRHRYPSVPIQGHHWPFDKGNVPTRHPIQSSYSVESTYLWAVGLFGTVENGAILLTTVCSIQTNRPLHILVGTLALADMYTSMIYIPSYTYYLLEDGINLTQYQHQDKQDQINRYGFSFCNISRWIFIEVSSVSVSLKMMISIYLLIYIFSRKMAAQVFSARNLVWYVASCWIGNGVVLFLPNALGGDILDMYPHIFTCKGTEKTNTDPVLPVINLIYREAVLSGHLVQLAVICLCFAKVHVSIRTGRTLSMSQQKQDQDTPITYHRATKSTISIFSSLFICWVSNAWYSMGE